MTSRPFNEVSLVTTLRLIITLSGILKRGPKIAPLFMIMMPVMMLTGLIRYIAWAVAIIIVLKIGPEVV
jgi:hypothetical protein